MYIVKAHTVHGIFTSVKMDNNSCAILTDTIRGASSHGYAFTMETENGYILFTPKLAKSSIFSFEEIE